MDHYEGWCVGPRCEIRRHEDITWARCEIVDGRQRGTDVCGCPEIDIDLESPEQREHAVPVADEATERRETVGDSVDVES